MSGNMTLMLPPDGAGLQVVASVSGGKDSTAMIVSWSRTDRGGRQMPIFAPTPRGGCMRWGLCETAPSDEDEDGAP